RVSAEEATRRNAGAEQFVARVQEHAAKPEFEELRVRTESGLRILDRDYKSRYTRVSVRGPERLCLKFFKQVDAILRDVKQQSV
ncbi:MAG: hypothetical protein AAFY60_21700, partial [Myxococcota bacterium]